MAHFLALLSPGPDFFLIMQAALKLPRRSGLALCAGIAAANGAYLVLALLGFALIKETSWLFTLVRYLGAMYLLFLGIMLLRSPGMSPQAERSLGPLGDHSPKRQFLVGFAAAILNPKNMVFYLSLFTVMVAPERELHIRMLYALWMVMVVLLWDCSLVVILGRETVKALLGKAIYWLEKLAGAALAGFGLLLPFT
jgi:threonine/homoserine/homoserine lactone efflux protein